MLKLHVKLTFKWVFNMNYNDRIQQARLFSAFAGPMITGILEPRRVGKSTLIQV